MGHSLRSELLRKILLGMLPGLFCGGLLTLAVVLYAADWRLLAPVWLGCYGLAVLAGGQYSVLAVRLMGFAFMGLAALSVAAPAAWGLLWLALGFGGVHLGFGAYIGPRDRALGRQRNGRSGLLWLQGPSGARIRPCLVGRPWSLS